MSKCPILRPVHVSVHSSRLVGKISVDGSTLAVADSWTTVAARLARAKEKKVPHFTLHVSVIPQNVDPWGWVKYFKEGASKNKNKGQLKHDLLISFSDFCIQPSEIMVLLLKFPHLNANSISATLF